MTQGSAPSWQGQPTKCAWVRRYEWKHGIDAVTSEQGQIVDCEQRISITLRKMI